MADLNYQNRDDADRELGGPLRQMFGPSKDEIWRKLAEVVDGSFAPGRVEARAGQWTVTLERIAGRSRSGGHTSYTRIRAPFTNRDGFHFLIYNANWFTPLEKLLGMQDVTVGDPAFDKEFVVQGNHAAKLKRLLANDEIRRLLLLQPHVYFKVAYEFGWLEPHVPGEVDALEFAVGSQSTNIEQLHQLFELFALTLHRLCHIGSAYEDDPNL